MDEKTKEPQYERCLQLAQSDPTQLGLMSNQVWHDDPKRLGFVLARYKFVAKMCSGLDRVLEIGCADGFGTRVVRQEVKQVTATEFDPIFVEDAKRHMGRNWDIDFRVHNMLEGPLSEGFDCAYAIDVIEHVEQRDEAVFLGNIAKSLHSHGVCIIGCPSLESQLYASPGSKEGHVNCKSGEELRALMLGHFHNVFMFSMNDEVVHTGFFKMAHYLWAIGCTPR